MLVAGGALKTVDEASLATVTPDFLRTVSSGPPSRVPRVPAQLRDKPSGLRPLA